MIEWTKSAREELDRYSHQLRSNLEPLGADLIIAGIKRRIDEEVSASRRPIVTEEDVRRILSRWGSLNPVVAETPKDVPVIAFPEKPILRGVSKKTQGTFVLLFGIVLPLVTLGIEESAHFCAEIFFDPIPTIWHTLLVGFVPLANFLVWRAARKGETGIEVYRQMLFLGLANGVAMGVAFFYTLLFLPLTPLAVLAILYLGMGLLPLAPLFSFISALLCRNYLRRMAATLALTKAPGLGLGLIFSLIILISIELPVTLTRLGLQMAASNSPETSLRGIRWLRTIGNEETMLRACYERPGDAMDLIGFLFTIGDPVMPEEARKIYYRVTGRPFNTVPPPKLYGLSRWEQEAATFDPDPGGEMAGGGVKGLSLAGSRLEGSIDPDAALVYLEWTLVFKNTSRLQREARAQIALPPQGVVSRLTLWIDGEEREAAFGARGKVRQAYEQVVREKRDPVLVTTSGPDRVLVQCFPVPPNGGEMKVRIGITAPLLFEAGTSDLNKTQGLLRLPYFLERNFGIPKEVSHTVQIESEKPVEAIVGPAGGPPLLLENSEKGLYSVRGLVKHVELAEPFTTLRVSRSGEVVRAWTPDPVDKNGGVIRQTLEEKEFLPPTRVVLVIDGSRSMHEFLPEVADALPKLPEGIEFSLVFASDEVVELSGPIQKGSGQLYRAVADRLRTLSGEGGRDNVPALSRAWNIAAESPNSAIVWIHGPHPILLQSPEELVRKWERRPDNPRLYEIQTRNGPNRIAEKLDGIQAVEPVPRLEGLTRNLEGLFSSWKGTSKRAVFSRERVERGSPQDPDQGKETSGHLARLWARDEVSKLLASKGGNSRVEEAIQLAVSYQLVTPVSGAVVLETQQQYQQTGLEPVSPGTVPTIPEPETWMLLLVVTGVLAWLFYRRRATDNQAPFGAGFS